MSSVSDVFVTGCMCPNCHRCSRSVVMKTVMQIDTLEDGFIERSRKCNRCGLVFKTQERVLEAVEPKKKKSSRQSKDITTAT